MKKIKTEDLRVPDWMTVEKTDKTWTFKSEKEGLRVTRVAHREGALHFMPDRSASQQKLMTVLGL